MKRQSWRLVTFETLITILTIENLTSWQSLLFDNYDHFKIIYKFYNVWKLWTIQETCDIWDTDYKSDNWEPDFMTIFVNWQLIVTLDSIHNSCDVFENLSSTYVTHLSFYVTYLLSVVRERLRTICDILYLYICTCDLFRLLQIYPFIWYILLQAVYPDCCPVYDCEEGTEVVSLHDLGM